MVTRHLPLLFLCVAVTACELDPHVLYACNPDGGCSRSGYSCQDSLCVPAELLRDAGVTDGGADAGALDAGGPDAGEGPDAGAVDAGAVDAGNDDAGQRDAGVDAGQCVTVSCNTASCGYVDAGAGCAPLHCGYCDTGQQCGTVTANTCSPSRLCNAQGWCWESPLPQGNSLRNGWSRSPRETFIVGDDATVLRFDGEKFELLPTLPIPRGTTLLGVGGDANVLVVAGSGGAVARWNGSTWSSTTGANVSLRSVVVANGQAFIVGGGQAYRLANSATSLTPVNSPTPLAAVAVTPSSVVYGLGENGALFRLNVNGSTYAFVPEATWTPPAGSGLDLAARGSMLAALTQSAQPDGGELDQVGVFDLDAQREAQAALPAGKHFNGLDVQADGEVLVLGDVGEARRVSRDGGVSGNLLLGSGVGASLRKPAFREVDTALLIGTDGHLSMCTAPCASSSDVVRLSRGSVRDMLRICGASLNDLMVAGDVSCSGGTCSHRIMFYSPSSSAVWEPTDIGSRPLTEGPLVACTAEAATGATRVVNTGGDVFKRPAGQVLFNYETTLATMGAPVNDLYVDEHNDWFALTGNNRLWRFRNGPAGTVSASNVIMTGGLRTAGGVNGTALVLGDQGTSYFIDNGTNLGLTQASSGSSNTQRDMFGRLLPDGGEYLVSAGDRGSVWWRVTGTNFSDAGIDAGTSNNLQAVWTTSTMRIIAASSTGQVVFGAPDASFVTTPTPYAGPLFDTLGLEFPDGGTTVWVVGGHGTVLSKSLP